MKLAYRHLMKSKTNTGINILGLSLGMAVALLAGLWVWDELSFDHVHANHGRLAQILSVWHSDGTIGAEANTSVPVAAALRQQFPGDFAGISLLSAISQTLGTADKKIGDQGAWVQSDFPAMFSLHLIEGTASALKNPGSLLISGGLAKALFGTTPALGKLVRLSNGETFKVGGIYEDLPQNSSISDYHFLLPWDDKGSPGKEHEDDWTDHHFQIFVQLSAHADMNRVSAKIGGISKFHRKNLSEESQLYPMDRWRLYDRSENGRMVGGRLEQVWLCGVISVVVLLLACINFVNLSTARSAKRARETGVRKVLGSSRGSLVTQFLAEALLTTFMATVLALLLCQLSISWFNQLTEKELAIPYSSPFFWALVLSFSTFVGLVSGSYPAFYLSRFQAIEVLKGRMQIGRSAALSRHILVTVQFTMSISLIVGVITIYRQVQFAKHRPVGYSPAGLITIAPGMPDLLEKYDALRLDLMKTGAVLDMAETSSPTTEVRNSMLGYDWEGRDPNTTPVLGTLFISHEFGKTIGWSIKEGRDFNRGFPTDSGAFVVNEAAVKYMGLKNPVGKSIRVGDTECPIIGVIHDMVMESPYATVLPTVFTVSTNPRIHTLVLRLNPELNIQEAIAKIRPVMMRYDPATDFNYDFVDAAYGSKFRDEEQTGRLTTIFAVLAVLISCMGLFGLVSFVAEQKTREISIRKTLGASVFRIWRLLSVEFLSLVLVSAFIATPLTIFLLHAWLQHFTYHTVLSWWIFLSAGAGAMFITLLTVSHQTLRAAHANPVDSLRAE